MFWKFQVTQALEPTAPPQTVFDPQQGPYNGPLPHIYPNLYSPGAPLHDPTLHGKTLNEVVSHVSNIDFLVFNQTCLRVKKTPNIKGSNLLTNQSHFWGDLLRTSQHSNSN